MGERVKAAALLNLARFVHWPPAAFNSPTDAFIIGVLGTDPFGKFLDELVKAERIGDRPIEVRRFGSAREAVTSHLLYVGPPYDASLGERLAVLRGRPVLLVGERNARFESTAGMVSLGIVGNRLALRINLDAANAANLQVSSRVLRIAEVVRAQRK